MSASLLNHAAVHPLERPARALLPPSLDDYVAEDNPVRVVEAFVEQLDLRQLGFEGAAPAATGRPGYHPAVLLKLYVYGYLNRIQSSRRPHALGSTLYELDRVARP